MTAMSGHDGALPDLAGESCAKARRASRQSSSLYEDKSRGSECDALDSSGNVVDADSADQSEQGEAYCCQRHVRMSYCGHRFRCGGLRTRGRTSVRQDSIPTSFWRYDDEREHPLTATRLGL